MDSKPIGIHIDLPTTPSDLVPYRNLWCPQILAYSFFERKNAWQRDGSDSNDDFFKAEYAIQLLNYLVERNPKKHPMFLNKCLAPEQEDRVKNYLISLVYGIFDTAYYLHRCKPHSSAFENFTEAERICCREKEIEHIAYFVYLDREKNGISGTAENDWKKAEKIIKEEKIRKEAYLISKRRLERREPGSPESDWIQAEKNCMHEEIIDKIAEICWERASLKYLPESVYKGYGQKVFSMVVQTGNFSNDIEELKQDVTIIGIIDEILRQNQLSLLSSPEKILN